MTERKYQMNGYDPGGKKFLAGEEKEWGKNEVLTSSGKTKHPVLYNSSAFGLFIIKSPRIHPTKIRGERPIKYSLVNPRTWDVLFDVEPGKQHRKALEDLIDHLYISSEKFL